MEYIALQTCYGFCGGRYIEEGEVVEITDAEKETIDADYFAKLFQPVGEPVEEPADEQAEEPADDKPKRNSRKKKDAE